jgi:acyl-coenzyme A synthetase/AMP-(fatty) acid ligase
MKFKNKELDKLFIMGVNGDWHSRKDIILLAFCYAEIISKYSENYIIIDFDKDIHYFALILSGAISNKIICPSHSILNERVFDKHYNDVRKIDKNNFYREISSCVALCNKNNFLKKNYLIKFNNSLKSDNPFLLVYSSGTTSGGTGILLSPKRMMNQSKDFANLCEFNFNSFFTHMVPHNYMAGIFNLFFVPFFTGGKIHLINFNAKTFSYDLFIDYLKSGVNVLLASPALLEIITRALIKNQEKFSLFKSVQVISTGSFLYPDLAQKIETLGFNLGVAYGVTELGGSISFVKKYSDTNPFDIGRFTNDTKIKKSHKGTLLISSPNCCIGTIKQGKFYNPFDENYYFDSDDIVEIEGSQISLIGRKSDIANRFGIKISAQWIESNIRMLSGVSDCSVLFKDSKTLGVMIYAYIIPSNKDILINKSTKNQLSMNIKIQLDLILTDVEIPDRIEIISEIPKTEFGKKIKRLLNNV